MRRAILALALFLTLAPEATASGDDPLAEAPALLLRHPQAALELAEGVAGTNEEGSRLALRAHLVIAEAQVWLGAPRLAAEGLEAVLRQAEDGGHRDLEAAARVVLSRALNLLQRYAESRQSLDSAERLYGDLGDRRGEALIASLRSTRAVRQGDLPRAVALAQQALDSQTLEPHGNAALNALSSLAYGLHQMGDLAGARQLYDELIDRAWRAGDQRRLHFAYCNRAETRWLQGESRPALDDLKRAIAGFEGARSRLHAGPTERARFLAEQVLVYDRLVRYLMDTDQPAAAFEVAERFHGRSFLETLSARDLDVLAPPTAEAIALREAIGRHRLEIAENGGDDDARQALDELEGSYQKLLEGAARKRPRLGSLLAAPAADLRSVQLGLAADEVLLAYWVSAERTMIWALHRSELRAFHVPVRLHDLHATLAAYLGPLRDPRQAGDQSLAGRESIHLAHGRRLYDWLIAPVEAEIDAAERILLVPDGLLHELPFEALVRSCEATPASTVRHAPYRACRFLGLDKAIAYGAAAGVFARLRDRPRPAPAEGLLAMAPDAPPAGPAEAGDGARERAGLAPLSFAQREVEAVADHLGGHAVIGPAATEEHLKDRISAFRFIHLATHGLVDDQHPMSSGVLLHGGAGEDGLLQAREVLGLDLAADLVALSACRSGRGELLRSEGILGLSRAFLTAGAASVLASQWDVDDRSTPLLMAAFYRHLAAGEDRAGALLAARRELFRRHGVERTAFRDRAMAYAHPRFWSSFVLIGLP